jgi:ABC-2 type transport system ATP-binding protein
MSAIEVCHVTKSFADRVVVSDLSFSVDPGEMFGLIGPNGAGKTTTIRMVMDIIKPDSGTVSILGKKLGEDIKNRLGYMPEERGLYKKLKVIESIVYLASLKGMDGQLARQKAEQLLDHTGLLDSKNKKVEELSKGMGQIIQLIVTIIHDPEILILDEPFSGLDPVNTRLVKGILADLRNQNRAIVLSTHIMNQVEELCDRILMVNRGQAVLYGNLEQIKSKYRGNSVLLKAKDRPGEIPGVSRTNPSKGHVELVLEPGTTPKQVLEYLVERGTTIDRFEIVTPSLDEIFVRQVSKEHE